MWEKRFLQRDRGGVARENTPRGSIFYDTYKK